MKHHHILACIALAVLPFLGGCNGQLEQARELGFSSVEEMKSVHAKGWHTKSRYESDKVRMGSAITLQPATEQLLKCSALVETWAKFINNQPRADKESRARAESARQKMQDPVAQLLSQGKENPDHVLARISYFTAEMSRQISSAEAFAPYRALMGECGSTFL